MGWAQRASRDRRRTEQFGPGREAQVLERVRQLAARLDEKGLDRLLATVPDSLKRAEMRKLMAPLVQR